jgi:hypothetical protein
MGISKYFSLQILTNIADEPKPELATLEEQAQ